MTNQVFFNACISFSIIKFISSGYFMLTVNAGVEKEVIATLKYAAGNNTRTTIISIMRNNVYTLSVWIFMWITRVHSKTKHRLSFYFCIDEHHYQTFAYCYFTIFFMHMHAFMNFFNQVKPIMCCAARVLFIVIEYIYASISFQIRIECCMSVCVCMCVYVFKIHSMISIT